ncbi:MAG: membrane-bound PQQ-dependent dehydrogenase, glucose/quinate/shikimate family, partial [Acinetobacter sp.]
MSESTNSHIILKIWCFILGLALLLTGLFFTVGGAKLVTLGGSWYFVISGLLTLVSALYIFKKKVLGVWLFSLVFAGTVLWALVDAGWEFWPLFSRLMFPAGLFAALMFSLPSIRRYQYQPTAALPAYAVGGLTVLGMIIGFYQMFIPHPTIAASGERLPLVPVKTDMKQTNWQHYGQDSGGSRFAALDQITRDNVHQLKEVWRFRTGDFTTGTGNGAEDQMTP